MGLSPTPWNTVHLLSITVGNCIFSQQSFLVLRHAVGLQHLQLESSVKNSAGNAPGATKASPALLDGDTALCVLVDSREISSGADVISSLKAVHGLKVQVCSLGSGDYVVSNRMAVERKFQSELLSSVNRTKVTQRLQRLQGMFERVCVIVEKDRTRPGGCSQGSAVGMCSSVLRAGAGPAGCVCNWGTEIGLKDLLWPLHEWFIHKVTS